MTTAKEAHDLATAIMEGMGKKATNFVGEWNTLLLYLEAQIRKEGGK